MWKIIFFAVCLFNVKANTSTSNILGDWVPVAISADKSSKEVCTKLTFTQDSGNSECTCTDGLKFELVKAKVSAEEDLGEVLIAVLVVEDISLVTPELNVTCDCGGITVRHQLVVKFIDENNILVYRLNSIDSDYPHSMWIYARHIPSRLELTTFNNSDDQLKEKSFKILCSRD